MDCVILYCRAGFEKECAAEIQEKASGLRANGFVRTKEGSGFAVFQPDDAPAAFRLARDLPFRSLVFARQLIVSGGLVEGLPIDDRVSPLLAAVESLVPAPRFSDVFLETADTGEAKQLSTLCRKLLGPFRRALEHTGRMGQPGEPTDLRCHMFFLTGTSAYPGISFPGNSSPWPMGIPRLRFPRDAPSRSTLKLEEAFHLFLTPEERKQQLRPGMHAVDLGAAPGGWSYQLVRRDLLVTAVDNGRMDRRLSASGLVEHLRTDGFRYRPERPVDWMVCDIAEQPRRISHLVASWAARGLCRRCIFNLKLPMKKRYAEVKHCRRIIEAELLRANRHFTLDIKQLYHDREEVTGCLQLTGAD